MPVEARLEPGERLELGAHSGFWTQATSSSSVSRSKQTLHEMQWRIGALHLAKRLEAPMRIGDQRTAERDVVGAAGLQHAFGILRRQHAAGHDDRHAHAHP